MGCLQCGDTGMVMVGPTVNEPNTRRVARQCACMRERAARRRLMRCGIPRRYDGATLTGFRTAGLDPSIGWGLRMAAGIVKEYPLVGEGLLLTGTCGVGKTHLAVALLAELVQAKGASGRFWDVGDLLVQLKRSYGQTAGRPGREQEGEARSEGDLIEELRSVDVLVLDELGAARVTDWSFDEIALMLGARYNGSRLTVITTNYPNLGPGEGRTAGGVRQETLGDRVGARNFSRLQEMTRVVEMVGADMRRKSA